MSTRQTLSWSLFLALVCCSAFFSPGCRKAKDVWPSTGKKRVLVSFPPLYCFTKNVAGDDADVRCLITAQGPHDHQLTDQDVRMAQKADLVLINGLGLDEWINKIKKIHEVFEVAEKIPAAQLKAMGGSHQDDGHGHGDKDPHVWLGPPEAKEMVQAIAVKLGEIDTDHKKKYEERADTYGKELDKLHEHGKAAFKDKKSRNIIATHDSLQYFADAFGLKVVGNIQPQAGIEADAKKLTGLVQTCKEQGVSVIAVEPQYSRGPAEALKNQLGKLGVTVELVEVDPLETAPAATGAMVPDPAYYMRQMYNNIDKLAKALR